MFKHLTNVAFFMALVSGGNTLVIDNPGDATVCEPKLLTWSGGAPPYFLSLLDTSNVSMESVFIQSNAIMWNANLHVGTSVIAQIRDSINLINRTSKFSVINGQNNSCLDSGSSVESFSNATSISSDSESSSKSSPSSNISTNSAAPEHPPLHHLIPAYAIVISALGGFFLLIFLLLAAVWMVYRRIPISLRISVGDLNLNNEVLSIHPPPTRPAVLRTSAHETRTAMQVSSSKAFRLRQAELQLQRQETQVALHVSQNMGDAVRALSTEQERILLDQMAALQAEVAQLRNENMALAMADPSLPPAYEEAAPARSPSVFFGSLARLSRILSSLSRSSSVVTAVKDA